MTVEIILLALASTIRPTGMAALYALLAAPAPRRLLTAYVISGLTFTIAFGLLVILAFNGIALGNGTDARSGLIYVIAGAAGLVLAALVHSGRIRWRAGAEAPEASGRWARMLEDRLTVKTAILAGPVTHIPGLFYLLALNVIAADAPKRLEALLEILVYNLVWFALPLGALAICIVRPDTARQIVGNIQEWSKDHTRSIISITAAVVGAALVLRGLLTLS